MGLMGPVVCLEVRRQPLYSQFSSYSFICVPEIKLLRPVGQCFTCLAVLHAQSVWKETTFEGGEQH